MVGVSFFKRTNHVAARFLKMKQILLTNEQEMVQIVGFTDTSAQS